MREEQPTKDEGHYRKIIKIRAKDIISIIADDAAELPKDCVVDPKWEKRILCIGAPWPNSRPFSKSTIGCDPTIATDRTCEY
jgi:hypothetical protein